MKKVVITHPIPEDCIAPYRPKFAFVFPSSLEELRTHLRDAHALVSVSTPVDAELLACAGPSLRVVGVCSVGYDHVDLAACKARSCALINTPRSVTAPTAELAVGLILAVLRGIVRLDRELRQSLRVSVPAFPADMGTLAGKTVGIVGFGRIGQATAAVLHALGANICYAAPRRAAPEAEAVCGAQHLPLNDLLASADIVSLHCPYRPENHHLMNRDAFARMKPGAYFINTARGKLVDEAALIDALTEGALAGAGLDVYEYEPDVPAALAQLDNVVLTPHIGTAAYAARVAMFTECMDGVAAALAGESPQNRIL